MGKAAKLKKLRRIASQLPEIQTHRVIGERVTGDILIEEGVKDVQGAKVEHAGNYRRKKAVKVPMNHYKQMKKGYNNHGMADAIGYARAVIQYDKQQKEKAAVPIPEAL